jgi:phage terminase large subunit-like protein
VILHYDKNVRQFYAFPLIYFANNPIKKIRVRGIDLTQWLMSGEIKQCITNRIDEQQVIDDILTINAICKVKAIGHDSFNKTVIIPQLEKALINVEYVSQLCGKISSATKLLDRIFAQDELTCINNAFKWQFKNVEIRKDGDNNIKCDKKLSRDSIDSVAALNNALELWRLDNEDEYNSTYTPIVIKF